MVLYGDIFSDSSSLYVVQEARGQSVVCTKVERSGMVEVTMTLDELCKKHFLLNLFTL